MASFNPPVVERLDEIRERLRGVPEPLSLLEGIFAFAPVGFQIYTVDGHCLLTNKAFRDLFGSEPPPDYNVLHDEIAERNGVLEIIRRAFTGETVRTPRIWYDARELSQVQIAEGRRVAIEATFFPIVSKAGAVSHVAVVFDDVTADARRHEAARFLGDATERLARSLDLEITLRSVAELGVPGFADWCVVDLIEAGEIRTVAAAYADPDKRALAEEMRRRYQPDPLGRHGMPQVLRTGRAELYGEVTEEILAAIAANGEHHAMLRQLAMRSAMVVAITSRGQTLGSISFTRGERAGRYDEEDLALAVDLGRRAGMAIDNARLYRRAEESRERLLAVIDSSPSVIYLKDLDGRHILANQRYADVAGIPREAIIGKTDSEIVGAPVAESFRADDRRVIERGEPVRSEHSFPYAGVERFWLTNKFPVRDADRRLYAVGGISTDITEQKRAQADAERANRVKDEFLAMLGHELRNPLAPIVTALEVLRLKGDLRSSHWHEVEVIERQVDHLVRLVDDLLDVSRITSGKVELKREAVAIAEVVAKAVEIASPLFEERRHHFTARVPEGSTLRVDGDPIRLAQVLANLLTNAARYTDPGGTLALEARREGSEVVISVSDDGIGISSEMLPRIFDLFVQGRRSGEREGGGLGLGLTLVRTLVQMHQGSVSAESAGPGRGSRFTVRLPALPAQGTREGGVSEREGKTGRPPGALGASRLQATRRPRKVLLVDDNEDAVDLLAEMLRMVGHEVEVAHDGPAALSLVERFEPEVAVLDIGLPVMDGYAVGERLRDRLAHAPPSMIALTGYGQDRDRARSREAGFVRHLVKPVDPAALLSVIDQLDPV